MLLTLYFRRFFDQINSVTLRHVLWLNNVDIIAFCVKSFSERSEFTRQDKSLWEEIILVREQLTHLFKFTRHFCFVSQGKDSWELRNSLVLLHSSNELRSDSSIDPNHIKIFISRLDNDVLF